MAIIEIEGNATVIGWYPVTKKKDYEVPQREMDKMAEICKFFDKKSRLNKFTSVIDGAGERIISSRTIDHFLNEMCHRDRGISYPITKGSLRERFNVSENFNEARDQEGKKYFDAFCRERKVVMVYIKKVNGEKSYCHLSTSIGQANLFMWLIKWRTLDYIINHKREIERDATMNKDEKEKKKKEMSIESNISAESPFIDMDECDVSIDISSSKSSAKKTRTSRKKRNAAINII